MILYNSSCQIIKDQFCRIALSNSINLVRNKYPFKIEAWVLLRDHLHCIWKLPDKDYDVALRWRLIKSSFLGHKGFITKIREKCYFDIKSEDILELKIISHDPEVIIQKVCLYYKVEN
jgi:REP element-mobilizing transposase RayT